MKNKVDWVAKLSSRKFWAFVAEFVTSLLVAFNAGEDTIVKVVAIIAALGGMVVYLLVEGSIDKTRAANNVVFFPEEENTKALSQ